MAVEAGLRHRIEELLADAAARREARRDEVHREMSGLEDRLVRFEALARQWLDELVVPRFEDQRDRVVTDLVCGMVFRRADAAVSLDHEGHTYYFCMAGCRDRFASDPEHVLATFASRPTSTSGGTIGGGS